MLQKHSRQENSSPRLSRLNFPQANADLVCPNVYMCKIMPDRTGSCRDARTVLEKQRSPGKFSPSISPGVKEERKRGE